MVEQRLSIRASDRRNVTEMRVNCDRRRSQFGIVICYLIISLLSAGGGGGVRGGGGGGVRGWFEDGINWKRGEDGGVAGFVYYC